MTAYRIIAEIEEFFKPAIRNFNLRQFIVKYSQPLTHRARFGMIPDSETHAEQPNRQHFNLWTWLRNRVDKANYRPRSAPGVVVRRLTEDGSTYYVLKNPKLGTYLKVSEEDYTLWDLMDGSRSVKDLIVAHFQRHKTFAFGRVTALVDELRASGFLTDKPVGVYRQATEQLDARDWSHPWQRLAHAFVEQEFYLKDIDRYVKLAYHWGGRLLFFWPVLILSALLALVGLAAFVTLIQRQNGYAVIAPENSSAVGYLAGVLALLLINAVMIFIHESAHALTTKHFGREIRRGGLMIYYGMPAFFVDTVDVWLEPKARRLAVSCAGPHVELVVAGLCSILAAWIADPSSSIGALFFKVAFLGYFSVFINLNPLLELDGYFILSDWLGIPMLRQRSFAFIREDLPAMIHSHLPSRLRSLLPGARPPDQATEGVSIPKPFSRDEIIFTVFGGLAALYTVYALWLAVYFWQTRIWAVLLDLWNKQPELIFKPLVALLVSLVIVSVSLAVGTTLWNVLRRLASELERRHFFQRERNMALVAGSGLAVILLAPALSSGTARQIALSGGAVLLAGLAVWFLILTARQYAGAEFQATFWGLALAIGVWLLGAGLRAVSLALSAGALRQPILGLALLAEQLATVGLLVAGISSLVGVDLRRGPAWEQVVMLGLLAVGFVGVLPLAGWTAGRPLLEAVAAVASAYFGLVFLALIAPSLTAYVGTPFFIPWVNLGLGAGLLSGLNMARLAPDWPAQTAVDGWLGLTVAAFWSIGSVVYATAGGRLRFPDAHWSHSLTLSEEKRLQIAFARFFETLFKCFRVTFGARRAQAVDDELDVLSATADWDVEIDSGRVRDELDLDQISILQQADRYREVLSRTMDLMDDWAGSHLAARIAQVAYDSLAWPERETLGRYVLVGTPWGESVADQFASARNERDRLLRGVPFFAGLSDHDFYLLQAALEYAEVPGGRTLARRGTHVQRFMLIQSGEVEVWQSDSADNSERLVSELRRGAFFGSEIFLGPSNHQASYRASVASQMLTISAAEAVRLRRAGVEIDTHVVGNVATAQLLGQMPIFANLSPHQIAELASRMRPVHARAGQVIVHEGQPRQDFYVVVEGQVSLSVRDEAGSESVSAYLGRGEHFGETALYSDVPYDATCRAETPVDLLALDEATFDALVASSQQVAYYVRQVSSGRALEARHKLLAVVSR
jgi:putative peptide zinc metalloprotease protein